MNRLEYEEAKNRLEEVTRKLKQEALTDEERKRLEREGRELAKAVMSPWLPFSWRHRIVMLLIALVGVWGVLEGQYYWALIWLGLFVFSPRLVGKCLDAMGGLKENDET